MESGTLSLWLLLIFSVVLLLTLSLFLRHLRTESRELRRLLSDTTLLLASNDVRAYGQLREQVNGVKPSYPEGTARFYTGDEAEVDEAKRLGKLNEDTYGTALGG